MDTELIRVALGFDGAYVPHAAATIASLAATTRGARLHVTIMHTGISGADQQRIESCAPQATFEWVNIDDPTLLALRGRAHISNATFYRFALPRICPPHVGRVIYLDCDLIVVRNILELWRANLNGFPMGAVYDPGVAPLSFARRWGLPETNPAYFNAGVLLIDLKQVRQSRLFESAYDFLLQNWDGLEYMDQDALNYSFWGRWYGLNPIWNAQTCMLLPNEVCKVPPSRDARRRPAIVHYTTGRKPWLVETYNPYAWLYWRNLARTPFGKAVQENYGVGRRHLWRLLARFIKHCPLRVTASAF